MRADIVTTLKRQNPEMTELGTVDFMARPSSTSVTTVEK